MRRLSLFFTLLVFFLNNSHAAVFYRHIPFTISLTSPDKLFVDYDFSSKNGVYCASNVTKFTLDFTYKGRNKSAFLPVSLRDHAPDKNNEELADTSGQFSILMHSDQADDKNYDISCTYVDNK